jgi:HEAT repeats
VISRLWVAPVVALVLAAPIEAGIFRRTPKPDPAVHVPALIQTLKTDKDEKARAAAASDLRDYDAKAFPDLLPALMDALATDPSSSVRSKAAEAIGKVRPISPEAGYSLEQAIENDKSLPVRLSARLAIAQYRVLGFIGAGKGEMTVQSAEPPLATAGTAKGLPGGTVLRPTPSPVPVAGPVPPPTSLKPIIPTTVPPGAQGLAPRPQSGEPPLAEPASPTTPTPVLTTRPRAPAPVITIPSPAPRETITPIPAGPTLPAPKPLPGGVDKPGTSPQGPTLGPPPGK